MVLAFVDPGSMLCSCLDIVMGRSVMLELTTCAGIALILPVFADQYTVGFGRLLEEVIYIFTSEAARFDVLPEFTCFVEVFAPC